MSNCSSNMNHGNIRQTLSGKSWWNLGVFQDSAPSIWHKIGNKKLNDLVAMKTTMSMNTYNKATNAKSFVFRNMIFYIEIQLFCKRYFYHWGKWPILRNVFLSTFCFQQSRLAYLFPKGALLLIIQEYFLK